MFHLITFLQWARFTQNPSLPESKYAAAEGPTVKKEILDAIHPPKEWSKGNKVWVQKVSSAPSTRADLLQLQEQLDMKLEQEQARHAGICPIRRELYSQCFDELIRQESVLCEERGLLLLRLRDEIRMSMAAHQKLYENTLSHGIRHVMRKEDLQERIRVLENEKQELLKEINEQKENSDANKKRQTEMRETAEKKYDEEKQTNQKSKMKLYSEAGILKERKRDE
ncbi:PREDICTED: axonemal dynein light intermediate polypeptide 1-like [Cyprinodon variegatus]|uniref:axonemal dynein light intermediate polypeptide 1-like n=1 Tax=Cyprinodon variegatus TaxID=28743 RepID=UPI000742B728|nr:PREDICTED: axonemal dynein light intermediate polypeptide 1-like [Cyprinodon variegatus]